MAKRLNQRGRLGFVGSANKHQMLDQKVAPATFWPLQVAVVHLRLAKG